MVFRAASEGCVSNDFFGHSLDGHVDCLDVRQNWNSNVLPDRDEGLGKPVYGAVDRAS